MRTSVLFSLFVCLLCSELCSAQDTLKAGQKITANESILVSAGKKFALGFFSPQGSTIVTHGYLGIWYNQSEDSEPETVVWVANREKPVVNYTSTGVFEIAEDGNLVVTDASGERYWSTTLNASSYRNRTVKLLDSGNLVLVDDDDDDDDDDDAHLGKSHQYLWQSFQNPTDTFLPGMKIDANLELTCWRSPVDPGIGNFAFKMWNNRYIVSNQNQVYWESGGNGELNSDSMSGDLDLIIFLLTNFTTTSPRRNRSSSDYEYTRLVMNSTGEIQFLIRNNIQGDWSVEWRKPESLCQVYNACGNFSSCIRNSCKCLPGFSSRNGYSSYKEDLGCSRKSKSYPCGKHTTFLTFVMMKIMASPNKLLTSANEEKCQSACFKMCPECRAYSYKSLKNRESNFECWIWTQDLITLQEMEDYDYGRNISVRVDVRDIAPTAKTCKPCGAIIVPYPLSTGPSCGDPMYFKFSCNDSTGLLSFATPTDNYTVTGIIPESRKFFIQVTSVRNYCNRMYGRDKTLQIHLPFEETDQCNDENEAEVIWQQPSEPVCNESIECEGWDHSSCKATTAGDRCLCDADYHWDGLSLSCIKGGATSLANSASNEPTPTSEGNSKSSLPLILGITLTVGFILIACGFAFTYVWRRKIDRDSVRRNRGRFFDSERHVKDLIDTGGLEERENEGIDVPYFDFETILEATNSFSDANKLGQGGYGPVYMGKLQGGQDIAVKRLSSVSSQGLQEFKNEVVLIAKLQHRNLVRLRGYCIKGDEKILLYEYMPNKSLDSFIFDPVLSALLDWQMRFDIILGIARGLLYLHQDSRLRVIHRDLKTSNILLDEEMQPKISDFGLARIFGDKETEANTERLVGTYGYMSPEYALDGLFSTKSDVFSFGVVLLEIISGKKNTGFYQSKDSKHIPSLLGYAWRLWEEDKLLDLMDHCLGQTCNANQFTRCSHIGLLCVQDEPGDRPSMSNIVTMLDSEIAALPTPKQPTFFASRGLCSTASSSKPEISGSSYQIGR